MVTQILTQIWKFPLQIIDYQEIDIPYPATILSVAEQHGNIVLYALVKPGETLTHRCEVWIIGTGHDVPLAPSANFVGTVKLLNGALMFHVFAE